MTVACNIPELTSSTVALGFFDGLHLGHRAVIEAAGKGCCVLSVGRAFRKTMPDGSETDSVLIPDGERDALLGGFGAGMFIAPPFGEIKDLTGEKFVDRILTEKLHATLVTCGENYRFGRNAACGAKELAELCGKRGIECSVVPMVRVDGENVSSTVIRSLLAQGDMSRVNAMLGRRYGYALTVVGGKQLGRVLGAPTINQMLPQNLLLPRFGVYASAVFVDGEWHSSVTNIGVRPTVGAECPLSETWILDFSGDLYGCEIRVELLDFIRPERKFPSVEELRKAIHSDAERSREISSRA